MKAEKITVKIEVEVLSIDVVEGVVADFARSWENQKRNGQLISEDGDTVTWTTKTKKVEF